VEFLLAIPAYLLLLLAVAVVSERFTPLVGVGGLLVLLALARYIE